MAEKLIELVNRQGMRVRLSPYGASIYSISLANKNGDETLMTVQPTDLDEFEKSSTFYGKTIGRTAGRLENGDFSVDGKKYHVDAKAGHGLHGGPDGLAYQLFKVVQKDDTHQSMVTFTYRSKDLEGGYPGNVDISIKYLLAHDENRLTIEFDAISDSKTPINLTNHVYYNLEGQGTIRDHQLQIKADRVGIINEKLIPTNVAEVDKTFDFRTAKAIGTSLDCKELVEIAGGYDHPFVLNQHSLNDVVVSLYTPKSNRRLNIYSTYPVVVFYSGNYPGDEKTNLGDKMKQYQMLALELQYLPNGINNAFGQKQVGLYDAHQHYHEITILEFIQK